MACTSCSQLLPDGARFCPFCGAQVAAAAEEERRLITVLFADIVGYTGLVEYLDPERAKRLLDDAFERLIADIIEFGGTIDKVLGDGVLALFGAPVAHEDDPDRAVRAALKMHESLAEFVAEHAELARPVQLRVGVNTGEVLFGRVGGTDDYTVMGDVVNVASRLEALASAGEIYVGDLTASLTSPAIMLGAIDVLQVRGREQSEMVWRVVGLDRRRLDLQVARDTPFVGRVEQRQQLHDVMMGAVAGHSAVVALTGEAGSGKTRLVVEVLDSLGDDTAVLAATCAPYGQTSVWAPIVTAMFGQIDPATTESAERVRDLSLEKAVALYGFGGEDPLLAWLVEGVLHVAGHPSSFDDMPLAQGRETLFRLIVEALRRRSAQGPLVLCVDDLHWADNLLIDLLHRIRRSLADRPFLLITAQRDDVEVDWPPTDGSSALVTMQLDPLDRADADELITAIVGAPVEPLLAGRLFERSGGNPLFLSELAALARSGGDSLELPSSLRVLIAARLDRLTPDARAIVDNAAVLGAHGPIESLERFAIELGQSFSYKALASLERDGLLVLSRSRRWRFRSDVVREVAYQTLTKVARAERHAEVAHVMSQSRGTPIGRLAHHAARAAELNLEIGPLDTLPADIAEQAVGLLCRAARRSLDVGAFRQARRDVDRALALEPADPEIERRLRLLRATAANELREHESVGDDALEALASAIAADDKRDEGTARRLIGLQAHGIGDLPTARRELDHAITIFRELEDNAQLATSLADRGFCEIFGGSLDRADVLLDEAEALAPKLGDRRASAWTQQHKALAAFLSGDTQVAAERLAIATRQFEELGDRAGTSWAQALRAYLAFYERRLDEAENLAIEARAEALTLGERWGPAMMDSLVASIRLWTGHFVEAELLALRSLTTFRDLGDRFGTVQSLAPYIRSLVALGKYAEAERGIEEALSLSESSGSLAFPAMAAVGAAVHLGLGDRSVVMGELALDRVDAMGSNGAETRTALALALCQAGRPEEALRYLLATKGDMPYTRAVFALAFAQIADVDGALEWAQLVADDPGATYLDRVIADVAAVAAEISAGEMLAATERMQLAHAGAAAAGDAVAYALTQHAAARFFDDAPSAEVHLGVGWHRVLDDLVATAKSPRTRG